MRVFVLCTGRCGSTTFTYACKHIKNYTADHESRARYIGPERLIYPDNHIEIDNRLSWFLGGLDDTYGDVPYYVHLTRDPNKVAESYARRIDNPLSIGAAHRTSILMNGPHDDFEICLDVVNTMRANIEFFLRDKSRVMRVAIENIEEDFSQFWDWIEAEGDKLAALSQCKTFYNDHQLAKGAFRAAMPGTQIAKLRRELNELAAKCQQLEDEASKAFGKVEYADNLYRECVETLRVSREECLNLKEKLVNTKKWSNKEIQELEREVVAKNDRIGRLEDELKESEVHVVETSRTIAQLQDELRESGSRTASVVRGIAQLRDAVQQSNSRLQEVGQVRNRLREEVDTLHGQLSLLDAKVTTLMIKQERLKFDRESEVESAVESAVSERNAFIAYSDELEARYLRVLKSHTWRILGPYRVAMRKIKGLVRGSPLPRNSLPEKPKIGFVKRPIGASARQQDSPHKTSAHTASSHSVATQLPVTKLGKRLWAGFSQSALRELSAIKDDRARSARDRSDAAYSLARWYAVQGEFDFALEQIEDMRTLYPVSATDSKRIFAESLLLCRLGRAEAARSVVKRVVNALDPAVQLILANSWNPAASSVVAPEAERNVLAHLNLVYERFGFGLIAKRDPAQPLSIDNIRASSRAAKSLSNEKVTVIIPVFNAEGTILTTLTSVAEQTWENLEVLVVDDVSTDGTLDIVNQFCRQDGRFRLIRQEINGGSYVCRNRALETATGDFVTIHDADDWSHPEKIGWQVDNLKSRSWPYNLTAWVRTTNSLVFLGSSDPHHNLIVPDHSSGLFRREVFDTCGRWDAVRISADTELFWRIENVMGNKKGMMRSRLAMKHCPLSFGRISDTSLTQTNATSVMTIYHGLRKEYRDAADHWHSNLDHPEDIRDRNSFNSRETFFPVPLSLKADRSSKTELSALFIADWATSDTNTSDFLLSTLREAVSQELRIGLLHYPHYAGDVTAPLPRELRLFASENNITVLAPGEIAVVEQVVVLTPKVFEHEMDRFPSITQADVFVVHNWPVREESIDVGESFDEERVRGHLAKLLGDQGKWIQEPAGLLALIATSSHAPDSLTENPSPVYRGNRSRC